MLAPAARRRFQQQLARRAQQQATTQAETQATAQMQQPQPSRPAEQRLADQHQQVEAFFGRKKKEQEYQPAAAGAANGAATEQGLFQTGSPSSFFGQPSSSPAPIFGAPAQPPKYTNIGTKAAVPKPGWGG